MNPLPESRASWPSWADFLQRRGLAHLAAWILEAAGPLTTIGAQLLYFGEPLLRPSFSHTQVDRLADLLADDNELRAFVTFLRAGEKS
ncbi:MAG: hypothetical protein ABIJ39_11545 [Chloroflexota bacterium]